MPIAGRSAKRYSQSTSKHGLKIIDKSDSINHTRNLLENINYLPISFLKEINKVIRSISAFGKLLDDNQGKHLSQSLSGEITKRVESILLDFSKENELLQLKVDEIQIELSQKNEQINSLSIGISDKNLQLNEAKELLDKFIFKNCELERVLKEKDVEMIALQTIVTQNLDCKLPPQSNLIPSLGIGVVPPLSKEEVQSRRDQVREMVVKERPIEDIPLYDGKKVHGEAVEFFKQNYAAYIVTGQEVIFAPDMLAIDKKLLDALRNECRSSFNPMPLGTVEDRTNARIGERFYDGIKSERSTKKVAANRRRISVEHC